MSKTHELPKRSARFVIDGCPVVITGEDHPTEEMARTYLAEAVAAAVDVDHPVRAVDVTIDDDDAVLNISFVDGENFERIRRITGYLVGTTARFNDAKQAEERERVKHPCCG